MLAIVKSKLQITTGWFASKSVFFPPSPAAKDLRHHEDEERPAVYPPRPEASASFQSPHLTESQLHLSWTQRAWLLYEASGNFIAFERVANPDSE